MNIYLKPFRIEVWIISIGVDMYSRQEKIVMWLSSFDFMSYKKAKAVVENFEKHMEEID